MHEITELEKRWLQYKLKKLIAPMVLLIVTSFALILFYFIDFSKLFYNDNNNIELTITSENNEEIEEIEDVLEYFSEDSVVISADENQTEIASIDTLVEVATVEPSEPEEVAEKTEVIAETQNRQFALQAYKPVINLPEPKPQTKPEPEPQPQPQPQTKQAIPQEEVIVVSSQSTTTFERSDTQLDAKSIEQRFNETKNIRHAVFLAKYYYDNKDYENSYKWSFTINQLDPINEEGWIYFAKSLYKLDRKDDAVAVLRSYLNHYRSSTAQETLRKILQGVL